MNFKSSLNGEFSHISRRNVCICVCMYLHVLGLEYICVFILVRRTELEGIEETKEISKRKKVMATKLFIDIY